MKSNQYYLLRREWLQYKSFGKSWLYVWCIYLLLFFLLGVGGRSFAVLLPVIMTYSAMISAQQTGEPVCAASEDFLLPVPLEQVVWARYLFTFLVSLASVVIIVAAALLQGLIFPEDAVSPLYILSIDMLYTGVITALGLPFLYRFGTTRGRILMIVVMLVGAAVGGSAAVLGLIAAGGADIPGTITLSLLAAAVLVWALMPLSLRLSVRFYRRVGPLFASDSRPRKRKS